MLSYYTNLRTDLNEVHKALVKVNSNIGVSFPLSGYQTVGPIIRLHSLEMSVLKEISGDAEIFIDGGEKHNFASRVKTLNFSKLRRFIKRNPDATEDVLINLNKKIMDSHVKNTFINMSSASTGQNYKLFLKFNNLEFSEALQFNSFGLLV